MTLLEIKGGSHFFQKFHVSLQGGLLAVQAVVYRLHQEAHCEAKSGRYFGGSSLQTSDELGDLGRLSPSLPRD